MRVHPITLLTATLLTLVCGASAQQLDFVPNGEPTMANESVKYSLLKPEDKTSEMLKPEERNPFGKSDDALRNANAKGTSEENNIRDRLALLRVVGASPGANGLRVMLGDMVLETGSEVPPVLVDQSVKLKVNKISTDAIELLWVEKKATGLPPRVLTLPVDLRPYVRYMLHGVPSDKNQWQKQSPDTETETIGRAFPEVSQTKMSDLQGNTSHQTAHSTNTPEAKIPTVAEKALETPGLPPAPGSNDKPTTWDKAVGFLNQLVKLDKEEQK
jgi:hypothetical protein